MLHVVLEVLDDSTVGVEFHDRRVDFRESCGGVYVNAPPSKEVVFSAMIVIVVVNQRSKDSQAVFSCLIDGPIHSVETGNAVSRSF